MKGLPQNQIQKFFKHRRILVTGASGYLATNLIESLKSVECTVVRLSRKNDLPPIHGKAKIIDCQGDIASRKTWASVLDGVDIVYHMAGQTSVYVADEDPVVDLETNVESMLLLLESCRKKKIKPAIIFSATSTEMGIPEALPVAESCSDQPITLYDLHKLMAENYLKYYCRQEHVHGASLRLTNVYGPGPPTGSNDRGVLNQMMRQALAGKPLAIYGAGNFIRDYVFIEDVVSAFLSVSLHLQQTNGKHFIIGSGVGHSISEAIQLVAERVELKTGKRVMVEHVSPPSNLSPIENRNFIADSTAFKRATGWAPQFSLEKGIDLTLEKFSSAV